MNSSLVSIVLPVYNVSDYVGQCLQSIIDQTYDNLEIIVIDDGSTDSSGEICETFASEDSRIRLYHRQNSGLSAARNFGIKQSTGEWIIFVDSDDFIERHMIEQMLQAAEACSAQIIIGREVIVKEDDCYSEYSFAETDGPLYQPSDSLSVLDRILNNRLRRNIWGILFESDLVRKASFPEGKIFEDIPFMPMTLITDPGIAYLNRTVYGYRNNPTSIMNNKSNSASMDRIEMKELQVHRIIEYFPELKAAAIGSLYGDYISWWNGAVTSGDRQRIDTFRTEILHAVRRNRPSWRILLDGRLTAVRRIKLFAGMINFPCACFLMKTLITISKAMQPVKRHSGQ